ncbi:MAG TPA: Mur ligase family protein [Actinomycetota bacterium]|nr:Mur ligase family protein [Actinomycetota bacterium]
MNRRRDTTDPVEIVEIRVYRGPNVEFPRPAIRLVASVPGWMRATEARLARRAEEMGLPESARPGGPRTEQRRRFAVRAAVHVTREISRARATRLAVRGRAGAEADRIEVVFPWRRRGSAQALAEEVVSVLRDLLATRRTFRRLVADAADRIGEVDPGPEPDLPDPSVPVVAVTGTNGKTSTVRILAHVLRQAGMSVAYSSTDGVYHDGVLVEEGDYAGPSGARIALSQPGVEVVVLETARGGILLQGLGVASNDVSVVTNVSRDHLGLHGIDTLDQLADVKGTITRVTRPDGWTVLNADDPRVLNMRRRSPARPFLFSLDHRHPAFPDVLTEHGRAATVLDGAIVLLGPGSRSETVIAVEDVPVTLAGVARHAVQNVLGVAAAAVSVGVPTAHVAAGLRTFLPDAETNPGRANVYTHDGRVVVVDYAHNEDGIDSLAQILAGFRRPGNDVWLAFGTAGDRSDEILHAFAYRAGRGADHPIVAELHRYLRGRDPEDLVERLRAGAIDAGATEVPSEPDEVRALERMLRGARRGDVIGITALAQRPEIFAMLDREGAVRADPATVKRLVRAARPTVRRARATR